MIARPQEKETGPQTRKLMVYVGHFPAVSLFKCSYLFKMETFSFISLRIFAR